MLSYKLLRMGKFSIPMFMSSEARQEEKRLQQQQEKQLRQQQRQELEQRLKEVKRAEEITIRLQDKMYSP